jgi:hypothetical protein
MNNVNLYQIAGFSGSKISPEETYKQDWEQWYPKYSAIIYGIILQLTVNKTRAGRILKEVIIELKRKYEGRGVGQSLLSKLIFKQTYNYTLQYLYRRGIKPGSTKPFEEIFPLLHLLYFDFNTVDDVANRLNQPKQDILRGLRQEFKLFRNLNLTQPI